MLIHDVLMHYNSEALFEYRSSIQNASRQSHAKTAPYLLTILSASPHFDFEIQIDASSNQVSMEW